MYKILIFFYLFNARFYVPKTDYVATLGVLNFDYPCVSRIRTFR